MSRTRGEPLFGEELAARTGTYINGVYLALDEEGMPYALGDEIA